MAVNVTTPFARPRRDACLDLLQMLSGAALVIFMWCHMILEYSVTLSPSHMKGIAWVLVVTYMD